MNQGSAPTCGGEEVGLQRFWLQISYLNGFDCKALQWGEQVGLERLRLYVVLDIHVLFWSDSYVGCKDTVKLDIEPGLDMRS